MDKELFDELRDRFDDRYKKLDDCDSDMDAVKKDQAATNQDVAVMRTMVKGILWVLSAVGVAVISAVVKYLFGG